MNHFMMDSSASLSPSPVQLPACCIMYWGHENDCLLGLLLVTQCVLGAYFFPGNVAVQCRIGSAPGCYCSPRPVEHTCLTDCNQNCVTTIRTTYPHTSSMQQSVQLWDDQLEAQGCPTISNGTGLVGSNVVRLHCHPCKHPTPSELPVIVLLF